MSKPYFPPTTSEMGRLLGATMLAIAMHGAVHAQTRHSTDYLSSYAGHQDLLKIVESCQGTRSQYSPAECAQAWQVERTLGAPLIKSRMLVAQAQTLLSASQAAYSDQYLVPGRKFYRMTELVAGFYMPSSFDYGFVPNSTGYQAVVEPALCNAAEQDFEFNGPSYAVQLRCYRQDSVHYLLVADK